MRSIASRSEASSVMSHASVCKPGASALAAFNLSALRPTAITWFSRARKTRAIARPMPEAPPVITMVFPEHRIGRPQPPVFLRRGFGFQYRIGVGYRPAVHLHNEVLRAAVHLHGQQVPVAVFAPGPVTGEGDEVRISGRRRGSAGVGAT